MFKVLLLSTVFRRLVKIRLIIQSIRFSRVFYTKLQPEMHLRPFLECILTEIDR